MATKCVEIEIKTKGGNQLFFAPIGRTLRGHLDFGTVKSQSVSRLRDEWPEPIPGKIIGVNGDTGEKYVREPLSEPEHEVLRTRIVGRGMKIGQPRETFDSESAATWLYWMRRAVDNGLAVVIRGELPPLSKFEGEQRKRPASSTKPRKNFLINDEEPPVDKTAEALLKLATAIEANTAVVNAMLSKLAK